MTEEPPHPQPLMHVLKDPFEDDEPVAQTCNTENPEACEACD